jgi:hypothetical protein
MSSEQKAALTFQALGLLNEQVEARIVHYKGDLETSPELDAITAQVVAQVRAMQAALASDGGAKRVQVDTEVQLRRTLAQLLGRAFREGSTFVTGSLKPIGRRVAKLFFESELHEKTKGDREKRIYHAEQGLYYVLQRYKHRIRGELEGFEYAEEEIRQATLELLEKTEKDLQLAFLSRRSPELNRVMQVFTTVLMDFLVKHLPSQLDRVAEHAIRESGVGRRASSVGYKVLADGFPSFRKEWENLFVAQLVEYAGDRLLEELTRKPEQSFRDETVAFFTDPHIFSETSIVLCDALYDFLCLEGFLDLPMDWRVHHARSAE